MSSLELNSSETPHDHPVPHKGQHPTGASHGIYIDLGSSEVHWFSNIQSFPLLEETRSLTMYGSHASAAPVRLQYFLCWSTKTRGRQNNHISMRLVKKYETYIINISGVSRLSSLVVSSSYFFTSRLIKRLPVPPKCPALIQGSQKCLHSHAASHSRPCYLDSTRSGEWWWMIFSYAIVR